MIKSLTRPKKNRLKPRSKLLLRRSLQFFRLMCFSFSYISPVFSVSFFLCTLLSNSCFKLSYIQSEKATKFEIKNLPLRFDDGIGEFTRRHTVHLFLFFDEFVAQSRRAEYKKESWTNFIYYFVICSSMVRYHKENMHYIWAKGSLTVTTNKFSKIDEISVFRKLEKNWKKNCEDIVFCQTIETTYNKTS